jgi:hypothetical protein
MKRARLTPCPDADGREAVVVGRQLRRQPRRNKTRPVLDQHREPFLRQLEDRYLHLREDGAGRGAALRALGFENGLAALPRPTFTLRTQSNEQHPAEERRLPTDTTIGEMYDIAGGRLMILGDPGTEKTTLLVELALDLLPYAHTSLTYPLPVIFDLSRWSGDESLLGYWLMEELVKTYDIPRRMAYSWVEKVQILPLLDGLDALDKDRRWSCVQAINYFAWVHAQLPVVVSSTRAAEDVALASPLMMTNIVDIQPLTDDQILAYLTKSGVAAEGIRKRVETDLTLREALGSSYLLSLVTVTYADRNDVEIPRLNDPVDWWDQLCGGYVSRMLERPGGEESSESGTPYDPEDSRYYLSWLASRMRAHNMATFSPRQLRLDWLPDAARWQFRFMIGIVFGCRSTECSPGFISG